ncbi:MAG: VCBS repeat-containing protein [bacterium]|nr:VCBS repeat-containing protein [bacterium]
MKDSIMKHSLSIAIAIAALAPSALALISPAGSTDGLPLQFTRVGTVSPAAGWTMKMGNFTAIRARDEVVGYHAGTGTLWVGEHHNLPQLQFTQWGAVSPPGDWEFVVGDVNGDYYSDVIGYYPANGTVWVGMNTGSSFQFHLWAAIAPAAGWTFFPGDFNGDGLGDVMGYDPGNGQLWAGINNGTSFQAQHWGTVSPAAGWRFTAGYFTPGPSDVVGHYLGNGSLWLGRSTGAGLQFAPAGSLPAGDIWTLVSAAENSGHRGLLAYDSLSGALRYGERAGGVGAFVFEDRGQLFPSSGWSLACGIMWSGGWPEGFLTRVLAYHPSNGSLWEADLH